jgi:2',3'-cyclic-nucleotide 2'-phosphodiesterase (5'-nucleotidase family)
MVQVSGLKASYDLSRPLGKRLVSIEVGGKTVDDNRIYLVATSSFLAQGGDLYETFLKAEQNDSGILLADLLMNYLEEKGSVELPTAGRLIPLNP